MAQLPGGGRATAVGVAWLLAGTVLTACGSDAEPERTADGSASSGGGDGSAVRAAFDRTAEADTARMTLRTQTSAAGQSATADGKGVIDLSAGDSTMTISAGGQRIEQRVVDQVVYQKVPERQRAQVPGKKPWIKIDLKKAAAQQNGQQNGQGGSQISDPAESAGFAKGITDKDTRKVGTEEIDGVNTTHYRVTVDVDKLSTGAKLKRQVGPTVPMDVWLDDEGRIRRQQVDMTIKAPTGQTGGSGETPRKAKVRTRIEFSDFGTEVEAQAPPAEETADVTDKLSETRR